MKHFICDKCQQAIGTSVYTVTASIPHGQGEYEYHLCQVCYADWENWLDVKVIRPYKVIEYLEAIPANAH